LPVACQPIDTIKSCFKCQAYSAADRRQHLVVVSPRWREGADDAGSSGVIEARV